MGRDKVLRFCRSISPSLTPHPDVPDSDWELWLEGLDIRELRACPKCGAPLIERYGKYGKFLGCRNYPHCKYTE